MILGGSWVDISGVISLLIWVISLLTLLVTTLITTHEPPSKDNDDKHARSDDNHIRDSNESNLQIIFAVYDDLPHLIT